MSFIPENQLNAFPLGPFRIDYSAETPDGVRSMPTIRNLGPDDAEKIAAKMSDNPKYRRISVSLDTCG